MSFKSSSSGRSESLRMESATVLVRGFPSTVKASELSELFAFYGKNSCTIVSGLAFICFSSCMVAYSAIAALDGVQTLFGVLQLTSVPDLPDGDGREAGASDNLYVLHIPAHWTETELVELFSPYGPVRQCRIFQVLNRSNCGSALVRMNTLAAARKAIQALNGRFPVRRPGESQAMPLVVRYADSPEEKARKKQRKEQLAALQQRILLEGPGLDGVHLPLDGCEEVYKQQLAEELLQQAVGHLKLNGHPLPSNPIDFAPDPLGATPLSGNPYATSFNSSGHSIWNPRTSFENLSPTKPLNPAPGSPLHGANSGPAIAAGNPYPLPDSPTSVYISNAPQGADNLWIYKRFAPHGAVLDVDVHRDGQCGGICSVKYMNPQDAFNAIHSMSGKDDLHLSLQKPCKGI